MEQSNNIISQDLEAQRAYVKKQVEDDHFAFDLTIADAFVRGIRDIGYKSTGTAIDELIDNSVQAEAENVFVEFGYSPASNTKPNEIAIIDDGHGMDPDMIRLAVVWGGTHREDNRAGFGRYGYGLPSASVSQGRRFTVYSLVEGGDLHKVTLDVDDISNGSSEYLKNGRIVVPEAVPAELPSWIGDSLEKNFGDRQLTRGTVVVLEKLEPKRLTYKTTSSLEIHLLQHFAVTYRNFLREVNIWVNDKRVDPVDPLFTTPGFRFYDYDDDRAEALEPQVIEVKESGKILGTIKVRYSYMPPTFPRADKAKSGSKNTNPRFPIMDENNGIIVMREGRQIDVVRGHRPWLTTNNDDRYWGCEVDFPAVLDEEFSITTSKQRVILSDRIWEILRENGVIAAIAQLRTRYQRERAKLKEQIEKDKEEKRASERAAEEAQRFKTKKPADSPEKQRKSQELLDKEVLRRARESGLPHEEVRTNLEAEIKGNPYKVREVEHPGAPFFGVAQMGGQKVLHLNTAHRFYTDVYAGPESTPRLRAAIESLLWALGESELDASGDRQTFYETERGEWSTRLTAILSRLEHHDSAKDAELSASDEAERIEEELAQGASVQE